MATPGYYKDKVNTSAVHFDHMLGSVSNTKTAIMAVALTKNNEKIRKARVQTFDRHIYDLPQHPLGMLAPQVKKP